MFEGKYFSQTCSQNHWIGYSKKKGLLTLEYRTELGQLMKEVSGLNISDDSEYRFTAADDTVYALSDEGQMGVYTPAGYEEKSWAAPAGAKLIHLGTHKSSLFAICQSSDGANLFLLDASGRTLRQTELGADEVSGNPVLIGDRLYLANCGGEILSCDLKQGSTPQRKSLEGVHSVQKMVGAFHRKNHHLLVLAHNDAQGKARSVLMLDPKTGEQVAVCSASQPRADILQAAERVVVATSSSYQNVIRVFEPLVASEVEQKNAA